MSSDDLIAAIATPPGHGGVAVIRVSGQSAPVKNLADSLLGGQPEARVATVKNFYGAGRIPIDHGVALYFPEPHSYTGESVLELQGHGGQVVSNRVLKRCVELGARLAEPGEFTLRAFLNDKLDLAQAEAVADLIHAGSERAAELAMQSLQGAFSSAVEAITKQLIILRVHVEAALDFPEEEIDFLADATLQKQLLEIQESISSLVNQAQQGKVLQNGIRLALIGQPNVGKSSLFNRLAQVDAAIVTDVAGTTRDTLQEHIHINGIPVTLIDTAGLRESDDPVEKIGISRSWNALDSADLILFVTTPEEMNAEETSVLLQQAHEKSPNGKKLMVVNKSDLANGDQLPEGVLCTSALTGSGIEVLRDAISAQFGLTEAAGETLILARERHLTALTISAAELDAANDLLRQGSGELLAESLRATQEHMSVITGKFSADDLLSEIFSSFCIGK